MSPIFPTSRKRSNPSESDEDREDGSRSKRRCVEPSLPRSPPPSESPPQPRPSAELFDERPRVLLSRAIALALQHVGFDAATPEALDAICSQAETYAARFLSYVTTPMLNARRSETTPLDFEYALSLFDLPLSSLEPHLKPPIPRSKLDIVLEMEPAEKCSSISTESLLGGELSGEADKKTKAFIPAKFPSFPSKHTYKWTEKPSTRETDPRKIREEAAKSARQGEEALRRLNRVSKARKEKEVKRAAQNDPGSKERHELWEKAMGDLIAGRSATQPGKSDQDEDHSLIVNSDRRYFRKGVPRRKPDQTQSDTIHVDL